MRAFAELFDALDSTNSTNAKVEAMRAYFAKAEPRDAAWGLYFLTGLRLKRLLGPRLLATWDDAAHQLRHEGAPGWSGPDASVVTVVGK